MERCGIEEQHEGQIKTGHDAERLLFRLLRYFLLLLSLSFCLLLLCLFSFSLGFLGLGFLSFLHLGLFLGRLLRLGLSRSGSGSSVHSSICLLRLLELGLELTSVLKIFNSVDAGVRDVGNTHFRNWQNESQESRLWEGPQHSRQQPSTPRTYRTQCLAATAFPR